MTFVLNNKVSSQKLLHGMEKTQREQADSLEKLSSGRVFTSLDPRPADRALTEGLEYKLRSLAASKRNINDGVSLLQTAEAGFSEVSTMLIRMKEINTAAASTTLNDKERKYLYIEYQALFDEINRIATSTEFNGIPLLNGENEATPDQLILRIGDSVQTDSEGDRDLNEVRFDGLKNIVLTTLGLGLKSVGSLLNNEDGVSIDDVVDIMESDDSRFSSIFDQALDTIANYRALFGAFQTRLDKARDYNDVAFENISAAKSKISDVDYASEVGRMAQNNILMQTTTALLTQNNLLGGMALNLINSLIR